MGTDHKFRKTKFVFTGEGKEILKSDGGEEIKRSREYTDLGKK